MPIKAEMRWCYPIDWPQLSRHVRFERASGVCQGCGRPHGETVRVLPEAAGTTQLVRPGAMAVADPLVGPTSRKQRACGKPG